MRDTVGREWKLIKSLGVFRISSLNIDEILAVFDSHFTFKLRFASLTKKRSHKGIKRGNKINN